MECHLDLERKPLHMQGFFDMIRVSSGQGEIPDRR